MYFALLAYPILGAGIKYADDAFDEKKFSKILAIALAPILGILGAYTMLSDPFSATILLAITAGVLLKGKIDNFAHLLGFCIAVIIIIIVGVQLLILPLLILAFAALFDEVGNDLVDQKKINRTKTNVGNRLVASFFDQRWVLKLVVLGIALIGIIPLYFFLAILLFDGAYILVRRYSKSQKEMPGSWFDDKIDQLKASLASTNEGNITRVAKVKDKSLMVYETRFFGA